jgi:hypothetical protein
MKTPQSSILDPWPRDAAVDLAVQIGKLFGYCPELTGFVVEEFGGSGGDGGLCAEDNGFVITEVGFGTPVGEEQHDRVCTLIDQVISNLIATWPEAFELVRGRTFARALH